MAALPFGVGPMEIFIILIILVINVALPVALAVFAIRATKATPMAPMTPPIAVAPDEPSTRCATCDRVYPANYDSCPYCARQVAPSGDLDVTKWSSAAVNGLLVATVWPLVYMVIFFASIGLMVVAEPQSPGPFGALFCVHGFTALLTMALMVGYLVIAIRSPIPNNAKILWSIAVVVAGMIVYPIAFYFLVWQPRKLAIGDRRQVEPAD